MLLAAANGIVPFLSDTYEGSRHDKPIADQTPYPLPEGSELLQDLVRVAFSLAAYVILRRIWRFLTQPVPASAHAYQGKPSVTAANSS